MKKHLAFLMIFVMLISMAACGAQMTDAIANQDAAKAEASGLELHKIGVATYNIQDAQVMMFKDYLDKYIKECFSDVTFLYSNSITNSEEMMEFLKACAENEVEGILSFNSYDLKKEVEFCAEKHMYLIRPSSTSSDADFASVAGNPWFVGEIGPGNALEYQAAADMTKAMAGEDASFVILSGGAFMGNEMHRIRTIAILDTIQSIYGVQFAQSPAELAASAEPAYLEADGVRIAVCPGYVELEVFGAPASEVISSGEYSTVLSVIPVTPLMNALNSAAIKCGVVDCFSEDNYFGFHKEKLGYVAGKFQSEIGPAFAALYNAITGHADAYRPDGKAFRLVQGYWTAASASEYDSMYALASGAAVNAYNYEDLYSIIQELNHDADFQSFKAMVEAYRYDDCLARRGE